MPVPSICSAQVPPERSAVEMLFNSFTYAFLFLPITVLGFYLLMGLSRRGALIWLTLASLFFYSYWDPRYLPLLVFSILFNFGLGRILHRPSLKQRQRQLGLWLGIGVNLALIAYFKYAYFIVDTVSILVPGEFNLGQIVLPLGISFFTFQQISYLVDVYQGKIGPISFLNYSLFISFFPQLIAGPIMRTEDFVPQLQERHRLNRPDLLAGMDLLMLGAFKKVILADNIASLVDRGFELQSPNSAWTVWVVGALFSLQVYFDFSGYTDMGRGAARLLGYQIPINFDFPYVSRSATEFWRRWHITLSQWLRDYLYIPLGGNRQGQTRTYVNLMITMTLGGLWHGAGWTFVLWGIYQGMGLVIHRLFSGLKTIRPWCEERLEGQLICWGLTYGFGVVGWILFRAENITQVGAWLTTMVTPQAYTLGGPYLPWGILVLGILGIHQVAFDLRQRGYQEAIVQLRPILYGVTAFFLTLMAPSSQQFIYFQF